MSLKRCRLVLSIVVLALPVPAGAASILMVADVDGDATRPPGSASYDADIAMRDYLASTLGHSVTLRDDNNDGDFLAVTPADLAGKDLLVVAESAGSSAVNGSLPGLDTTAIPIVNMQQGLMDELGMSNNPNTGVQMPFTGPGTSTVTLTLADNTHPLGTGVGATGLKTVYNTNDALALLSVTGGTPASVFPSLNLPASAAQVIATFTDSGFGQFGVLVGYAKGGTLATGANAPAVRVGFFLSEGKFGDLTADGLQLFDNAIGYGIANVPEPATCTLLVLGAIGLLWRRGKEDE